MWAGETLKTAVRTLSGDRGDQNKASAAGRTAQERREFLRVGGTRVRAVSVLPPGRLFQSQQHPES